ncbi:Plant/protein [Thalictrum thalictroides]|uniref:Plant/protein n=1 Tax=Thalictrum thalictroides TaxID=46969 RepID=A0A7J6UWD2_THATH|nr:Plant/protein [Thalictrum thalictroides]
MQSALGNNFNQLWNPWEKETIEYFTLGDLWSCYDEWSAYGVGVPIALNKQETVVQYYVPYLSAIQVFTSNIFAGNFREDSVTGDSETRDSFSDTCSDETESEKSWRWEGGSSGHDSNVEQEKVWNQNDRLGYLYFQYFERSTPYGRVPLMDKVNSLARRFPGLMTLKSIDLSPASWMAVAWYPIYHIPTGRTVKDLSACFLTFHTLSSTFQDSSAEQELCLVQRMRRKGVTLSPFGLATYKMQGSVWVSAENGQDEERLVSLYSAADSWLKQLGAQHHDFNYFTGIRYGF